MTPHLWTPKHGLREYRPWPLRVTIAAVSLAVGLIGGYTLASYQTKVSLELLAVQTDRLLLAAERHDLPRGRVTTKLQAAAIVSGKEQP